jgi:hypothetical protein
MRGRAAGDLSLQGRLILGFARGHHRTMRTTLRFSAGIKTIPQARQYRDGNS